MSKRNRELGGGGGERERERERERAVVYGVNGTNNLYWLSYLGEKRISSAATYVHVAQSLTKEVSYTAHCVGLYMCTCTYMYIHTWICVYVHALNIYIYIYMYVHICICACTKYIHS